MGHLSAHMLQHLVLMNGVAPAAALLLLRLTPAQFPWRFWPLATIAQLVLLWGWHSPAALGQAMGPAPLMAAMHISLGLSAFWFWASIFAIPVEKSWRAVLALLVTGKLFCLLGALLVFSPNPLFGHPTGRAPAVVPHHGLEDQQVAGTLMLVACPLSYVAVGIWIASRWFLALHRESAAHG